MAAASILESRTLSFGVLRHILAGKVYDSVVLQILGYKEIPGSNNTRFRLLLNDGVVLFPYAILASQLNNLIYDKHLEKYTIFRLNSYAFSQLIVNKKVIICLDIEILVPGSDVNYKISEKGDSTSQELFNDTNTFTTPQTPLYHPVANDYADPCPSTSDVVQNWDTAPTNTGAVPLAQTANCNDIRPVSSLSPYCRKWMIKARVFYKTPLINYNNARRQGKYFSFYLMDESGEIRATAFDEIAEKYYNTLEIFKIYFISNAYVKRAQENSILRCDFELVIENTSKIEPYRGLISSIPMPVFNFVVLSTITSLPKDSSVDVIGICFKIYDVSPILTKSSNREISKRNITIIDSSKIPVTVTLWDANAESFPSAGNHVIAIKNAKVTNYGGVSLNVSMKSMLYINPNIRKAFALRSWFRGFSDIPGPSTSSNSPSKLASQNWKTIAEVLNLFNSCENQIFYYTLKATIVMVKKEKCLYQACTFPGCNKKVVDLNNGQYRCNKCDLTCDKFKWSLCLCLEVADFTGCYWVSAFQDVAECLLNISCEELYKVKNENPDKYYDILNNLNLTTYAFKIRSQFENFNDRNCYKSTILNFLPLELVSYSKMLLANINKMRRLLNNTS